MKKGNSLGSTIRRHLFSFSVFELFGTPGAVVGKWAYIFGVSLAAKRLNASVQTNPFSIEAPRAVDLISPFEQCGADAFNAGD